MNHRTIWAGIPKKLVRKSDGMDFGPEITLGYTHYIGGKKLDTPLWELEEHYERVVIPNEELRLGMVFKTEDNGTPYTITAFTEDGMPIYGEGELEVEIPEGYWEQFEPQPIEEEIIEEPIEEEKPVEVGDEIIVDGKTMRCVAIENGVPQWTIIA
jgi:hypothetical protein